MQPTLVTKRAVEHLEHVTGSEIGVAQVDRDTVALTLNANQLDRLAMRLGLFDDAHVARHEWAR